MEMISIGDIALNIENVSIFGCFDCVNLSD